MSRGLAYYLGRIVAFYRGNWHVDGLRGVARLNAALALSALGPFVVRLGASTRECPCCGWRGARFLPFLATGYVIFNTLCPRCGSAPRHRAHRILYDQVLKFPARRGDLLYFLPESNLDYFTALPGLQVKTTSYPVGETDYNVDILAMPFPDASWDFIVCHRVIEHLSDDRRGMREFLRVLRPGGIAVVSVPIEPTREATVEFGKPNPLENEHYYNYGTDFECRIPGGFEVETHVFSKVFSKAEWHRFGLIEDFLFVLRKPCNGSPGNPPRSSSANV